MPQKVISKAKKSVKKTVRRTKRTAKSNLLSLILFIVVALIAYWYATNLEANDPITYGASQNEEGFYYYTLVSAQDYYYSANHLEGESLESALRLIVNEGFSAQRYQDAKDVLALADLSLSDPTKVMNIYNGALVQATWDSTSWHREHVWPNARLGIPRVTESGRNQASDLHNLRAITPAVNSSRSDRFFSAGSGSNQTTADGGYYPGDDHKGDVARILLYMVIMYDFLTLTDDNLEDESNHYTMAGATMGKLFLLLEWHKEDPVDDFERQRNQVIFEAQGNRNPFIDKPEYVHLIWENKTIEELLEPEDPIEETHVQHFIILMTKSRGLFYA
jgi:endonuclease I